MRKFPLVFLFLLSLLPSRAQQKSDSLRQESASGKKDTNTVMALKAFAEGFYYTHPDSAYYYADMGLQLATQLHFLRGQATCLFEMANALLQKGNYPAALNLHLRELKIAEQIQSSSLIRSTYTSLAFNYQSQKDYLTAVAYMHKSLEIVRAGKEEREMAVEMSNLGGIYADIGIMDSAQHYLKQSYAIFRKLGDTQSAAFLKINLAEAYIKMHRDDSAIKNYREALPVVTANQVTEALCEISFYMAGIFQRTGLPDSALYYGREALTFSKQAQFLSRELDATSFLASFYEGRHNTDSTLKYLKISIALKDSLFNEEKSKEIQNLTFDEMTRQRNIEDKQKQDQESAIRTRQLIVIAFFIPIFFLFVLLMGRIKVKARVVEFLAIINLLLFFEFITDLVFPYISDWTNDRPVGEMLILVGIAALLEPLNHVFERWVKQHLVKKTIPLS
jgi:tetratricopeptide (TPR) repeat protein